MATFKHVAVLTLLSTVALSSSAQAGFCLFGCTDVDVVSRGYDVGSQYYVSEPSNADTLSDTQTYSVYRSGEYVGQSEPVASFQLTNLHTVCCDQPGLRRARQAVRLSMGNQHVDICAYRPDLSNYAVNLNVSLQGSELTTRLSFPSGNCRDAGGAFNADVQRDIFGNVISQTNNVIPGLEDVTSVQLSEGLSHAP